jgi:hypothetical protein
MARPVAQAGRAGGFLFAVLLPLGQKMLGGSSRAPGGTAVQANLGANTNMVSEGDSTN